LPDSDKLPKERTVALNVTMLMPTAANADSNRHTVHGVCVYAHSIRTSTSVH
jgi:hypothetical protein